MDEAGPLAPGAERQSRFRAEKPLEGPHARLGVARNREGVARGERVRPHPFGGAAGARVGGHRQLDRGDAHDDEFVEQEGQHARLGGHGAIEGAQLEGASQQLAEKRRQVHEARLRRQPATERAHEVDAAQHPLPRQAHVMRESRRHPDGHVGWNDPERGTDVDRDDAARGPDKLSPVAAMGAPAVAGAEPDGNGAKLRLRCLAGIRHFMAIWR